MKPRADLRQFFGGVRQEAHRADALPSFSPRAERVWEAQTWFGGRGGLLHIISKLSRSPLLATPTASGGARCSHAPHARSRTHIHTSPATSHPDYHMNPCQPSPSSASVSVSRPSFASMHVSSWIWACRESLPPSCDVEEPFILSIIVLPCGGSCRCAASAICFVDLLRCSPALCARARSPSSGAMPSDGVTRRPQTWRSPRSLATRALRRPRSRRPARAAAGAAPGPAGPGWGVTGGVLPRKRHGDARFFVVPALVLVGARARHQYTLAFAPRASKDESARLPLMVPCAPALPPPSLLRTGAPRPGLARRPRPRLRRSPQREATRSASAAMRRAAPRRRPASPTLKLCRARACYHVGTRQTRVASMTPACTMQPQEAG